MMQMYNAAQLRQIHEERIAPYIKGQRTEQQPNQKATPQKANTNLLKQIINLIGIA